MRWNRMSKRAIRQPGFSIDYVKAMREEIDNLTAENERLRLENERLTKFMETAINFYPQLEMALPEELK
jgi:regulator of replication initiation timing